MNGKRQAPCPSRYPATIEIGGHHDTSPVLSPGGGDIVAAQGRLSRLSGILVIFLSLFLLVESYKPCQRLAKGASCLLYALKLDVKQFPTRNTPSLPRHSSTTKASLPPSCKLKVGLHLLKLSLVASSLVLLSGDVSINPGPYVEDMPKARSYKVAHLNVRSLLNKLDKLVVRYFLGVEDLAQFYCTRY